MDLSLPETGHGTQATSPFVFVTLPYISSFLSYNSGFFPPYPVLSKLPILALKAFHTLTSTHPSNFSFFHSLCTYFTFWPNWTPYQRYPSFSSSKQLPMLPLMPKMPFSHLLFSEPNIHPGLSFPDVSHHLSSPFPNFSLLVIAIAIHLYLSGIVPRVTCVLPS